MGAMTKTEILDFYADLIEKRDSADRRNFRDFLERLFRERDLAGCTFFTSLHTFCIVRFPTYAQWRFQPTMSLRIASSANVRIELRLTQQIKPALRAETESSSAPYAIALEEFDRLYAKFLAAHDEA